MSSPNASRDPERGWDRQRRTQVVQHIKDHYRTRETYCDEADLTAALSELFSFSYDVLTEHFASNSAADAALRKQAMEGQIAAKYISWNVEMIAWVSAFAEKGNGDIKEEDEEDRMLKMVFIEKYPSPDPIPPPWDMPFTEALQARLLEAKIEAQAGESHHYSYHCERKNDKLITYAPDSDEYATETAERSISPVPAAKMEEQRPDVCRGTPVTHVTTSLPPAQAPARSSEHAITPRPYSGNVSEATPSTLSATPTDPPQAPTPVSGLGRSVTPVAPIPTPASTAASQPGMDMSQAAPIPHSATPVMPVQAPIRASGPATAPSSCVNITRSAAPMARIPTPAIATTARLPMSNSQVPPVTRAITPMSPAQMPIQASVPVMSTRDYFNINQGRVTPTTRSPTPVAQVSPASRSYRNMSQVAPTTRATTPLAPAYSPITASGRAILPSPNGNVNQVTPDIRSMTTMARTQASIQASEAVPPSGPCNWNLGHASLAMQNTASMSLVQAINKASGSAAASGPYSWDLSHINSTAQPASPMIPDQAPTSVSRSATPTAPVTPIFVGPLQASYRSAAPVAPVAPMGSLQTAYQSATPMATMAPRAPTAPSAPVTPVSPKPPQKAPPRRRGPSTAPRPSKKRKTTKENQNIVREAVFSTKAANAGQKLTHEERGAEALAQQEALSVTAKVGNLITLSQTLDVPWREIYKWTSAIDRILDEERGKLLNTRHQQRDSNGQQ